MSRVASNLPTTRLRNGVGQPTKPLTSRSSSSTSLNSSGGGGGGNIGDGRGFNIRSAAPPPVQKETVHACPLCNSEYKDPRVLPCTHTYCFNCIRDKLIKNSRITCPKCHYQAHPFEEAQLHELPPNLILSQKWRIGARPMPSMPIPKNPVTYQSINSTSTSQSNIPSIQILQPQDKRKSIINENNEYERSTNITNTNGVASIVNAFNQTSVIGGNTNQSSRSSSTSSTQPVVSNLIKIYSEARALKPQQNENIVSAGKHDELTKIFQQIINQNQQQQQTTPPSNDKEPSQAYEEVYEEITWDHLANGITPAAPPFPEQLQTATVNHHRPPDLPERPLSTTSSDHHSTVDNLRDIFIAIHQQSPEKNSSFQQIPITEIPINSRLSTPSRMNNDDDDDININQTSLHQNLNTMTLQQQHTRQVSNTDSVHSGTSDSTSRPSIISPIINNNNNNNQQRFNETFTYQQQDDKMSHRTVSTSSLSRHSLDPFPPPPQNLETSDTINNDIGKQRSTSAMSYRSSINDDRNEHVTTPQPKLLRTERVNPDVEISSTVQRTNSSRINNTSPTPINRVPTISIERDTNYSRQQENYLSPSTLLPTIVTSRVDILLTDQKRLEREIEEQIRRLKYDYDDVRKQIGRKETSIHNEVKSIAARLDNDITEHYHRKQKIYADLAADTNIVGTELERLRSNTNNNKQQLWANLEQIESNIRNIRQAVEQQKEPHTSLTFAEGRRAIAADTIGQITYNDIETNQRYTTSPTRSMPTPSSLNQNEQTITNLTPFKYFKIDHLSTLEPEAIAITENNKKILLGICNKLFILNEYGDALKTIQLTPSIRGIAISKKYQTPNIAYISHGDIVSMIDIDSGQTLDCVKETDASGESGTFLPLGIDTDNVHGHVYVCDYRNSCVIKFDDKLEFITQWRIYNHSDQYDEARPKLISAYGQRLYIIIEHSCKPYYNQGIAYTFSLHICDANSGNIIKIIDAELLSTERLRWPCSVQAINNDKCYILDTMTSGKYFNGQWQKHWSRVLEIGQNNTNIMTELFQLDSEAAAMTMTKQIMIIAANGEILFVDLGFLQQQQKKNYEKHYQNIS
ncbi:unnamed protein product [Rotaria sp. Silwood1]|nr:unnamed protein product [Rotaria sp. Silwood1]